MLAEPDLDHRALAAALDEHHGLAPRTLRFVPAGETAWCYRLTDDRGGRWFLKLARPGAIDPARAEFALGLAGALAALGLPVPRPRPTRSGRRWCRLDGLRMAVFELVDADPLDDRALAEPATAKRVARLVAAIHAATPARGPAHHAGARAGPGSRCRHTASGAGCATATSSPTTSWWTGPAGLDPDLVAFFLLRHNLDDLADWLGAALEADRPDPQRRADLDGSAGACHAGRSWRPASATPAGCWPSDAASADATPGRSRSRQASGSPASSASGGVGSRSRSRRT